MMAPAINLPANATNGVWLRCPSVSGGKDWLCFQVPGGVVTFWGKTGQVNQQNFKQGGYYLTLYNSKIQKGYNLIGTWQPSSGWTSVGAMPRAPEPPPHPKKPAKPTPKVEMTPESAVKKWVSEPGAPEWF
jgi:hypothetical protein